MIQINSISNTIKRILLLGGLLASIFLTGCALTPTVANIDIPTVANPTSGPVVKIVSVEDKRDFGPFVSGQCDQPSVEGDYHDKALTSRVFGRNAQCGKFERANYMLPEGQAVAGKIKEVVSNAFKSDGYKVLPAEVNDGNAIPVTVDVIKSWSYYDLDGLGLRYNLSHSVLLKIANQESVSIEFTDTPYYLSFSPMGIGNKTRADFYQESLLAFQHKIAIQLQSLKAGANTASYQ